MTKKAHLTLANHIADRIGLPEYSVKKFIFYSGNLYPDISLMFLVKRHYITNTFKHLERLISWLNTRKTIKDKDELFKGRYLLHLGKVNHFIADFFTLPHNITFEGVKAHLIYERLLLKTLNEITKNEVTEDIADIHVKKCNADNQNTLQNQYSLPDESSQTYYTSEDYKKMGNITKLLKKGDDDTVNILKFIIASHFEYLMKVKEAILQDCPSNKKAQTLVDLDSRYIVSVCTQTINGIVRF